MVESNEQGGQNQGGPIFPPKYGVHRWEEQTALFWVTSCTDFLGHILQRLFFRILQYIVNLLNLLHNYWKTRNQ